MVHPGAIGPARNHPLRKRERDEEEVGFCPTCPNDVIFGPFPCAHPASLHLFSAYRGRRSLSPRHTSALVPLTLKRVARWKENILIELSDSLGSPAPDPVPVSSPGPFRVHALLNWYAGRAYKYVHVFACCTGSDRRRSCVPPLNTSPTPLRSLSRPGAPLLMFVLHGRPLTNVNTSGAQMSFIDMLSGFGDDRCALSSADSIYQ